ncbi:probable ATP-dependent RNA helicase DHX58 isoform X2 [Corythoichthys intestinalis]|uniref:probable ATP-dependent RNA helicase DHX58 isoform X2 n=1 Tax=Corythoichthys intestinalis TaxID=161448 RepID=UPI0025A5AC02|nr:probable ATP-dependent RNA helicase DHX58 isoform X2 [Corythoichthys intestinalis]
MSQLAMYEYQREVVQRALRGENIIVWLPPGAGKTRAAVYVALKHLETTPGAKVVVLVPTVHLVEQHYRKEFFPGLGHAYKVTAVSGDSDEKNFLAATLRDARVLLCTAQILLNGLTCDEEAKRVELSDITLLVLDECHHTQKETPYNKIMRLYLEKKMGGDGALPQVLGLTASPGSGGAKSLERAVDHVLQICANLDCAIVSTQDCTEELHMTVKRPRKTFDIAEKRQEDPFGDHVQLMMRHIHRFMKPPPDLIFKEFGTQEYENDVVTLKKKGVANYDRPLQQCAIHLREYNDALLIHDTLLARDALSSLEDFYAGKETNVIDDTDRFLLNLFKDHRSELTALARDPLSENPKMARLESTLLEHFGPNVKSRGILFSGTRKSTHCLNQWVRANDKMRFAGIEPAVITGSAAMTQADRDDAIRKFRSGSVNLLIATSVAEEGLDIPQCDLVVRYGLLTNEIAQQQASGRARAPDSRYALVARRGGREERREHLNDSLEALTAEAVESVRRLSPGKFREKIAQLQALAASRGKLAEMQILEKNSCYSAAGVQLLCSNCLTPVAQGDHIQLVEKMHYVNVRPEFRNHYYKEGAPLRFGKTFEDWEPGCIIKCKKCNEWGFEMKYRKAALLPNLAIKNFVLQTPGGRTTVKKWKDVPFCVQHFDFAQFCRKHYRDLLDS